MKGLDKFFGSAPLPDNRPIVRRFDEYDHHDANGLEKRLNRLPPELHQQILDCLKEADLLGGPISNQRLLKVVYDKFGEQVTRVVKERALTDFVREGLSPDQVQKNLAYSRYASRRNQEAGVYNQTGMFQANPKSRVGIVGLSQIKHSGGINDTGTKPSVSAKRTIL